VKVYLRGYKALARAAVAAGLGGGRISILAGDYYTPAGEYRVTGERGPRQVAGSDAGCREARGMPGSLGC